MINYTTDTSAQTITQSCTKGTSKNKAEIQSPLICIQLNQQ